MKHNQYAYVPILLLGVIGIFGSFLSVFPLAVSMISFLCCAIPLFLLCVFLGVQAKKKVMLLVLFVILLVGLLTREILLDGLRYVYNSMVSVYATHDTYAFQNLSYTTLLSSMMPEVQAERLMQSYALYSFLYVYVIFTYISSVCLHKQKGIIIVFLSSVALYVPSVLYKTPPNYVFFCLLISFWLLLCFVVGAKKTGISIVRFPKLVQRCSIIAIAISIGVFFLFSPAAYQKFDIFQDLRSEISNQIEAWLRRDEKTPGKMDLSTAGNRIYTNAIHMEVETVKPQELYLKDFSASIYSNNEWNMLEEQVYKAQLLTWANINRWVDIANLANSTTKGFTQIVINDKRKDMMYAPIPYYYSKGNVKFQYDAYAIAANQPYEYSVWNETGIQEIYKTYANEQYLEFVNYNYLQMPDEVRTTFYNLQLKEKLNYVSDVNVLAAKIRSYLDETAKYTLSPGATPAGKEFVSYFLNENKQGYCVHFATAATMMFRYMGVPARYVEGHRVRESDFGKNGKAKVSDSRAHAWVEIFDKSLGWIPVEVTPAPEVSIVEPDEKPVEETPQETPDDPDNTQTKQPTKPTDNKKEADATSVNLHLEVTLPIGATLVGGCLLFLQRKLRYQRWLKTMKQTNRKKAVISCYHYLKQWTAYEVIDFVEVLPIMDKALYSLHEIEEAEYQVIWAFTMQTTKDIMKKVSWSKKGNIQFYKALK